MFVCGPGQLQQHHRVSPSEDNDNVTDYAEDQGQYRNFRFVVRVTDIKKRQLKVSYV